MSATLPAGARIDVVNHPRKLLVSRCAPIVRVRWSRRWRRSNRAAHDRAERASWNDELPCRMSATCHVCPCARSCAHNSLPVAVVGVEVQRMTDLDGEVLTKAHVAGAHGG